MQLYNSLQNYIDNRKNFYKLYFFLVVFLCIVKLPSLFTSDIQPWDEGMYATRVLSIQHFGDFVDQSSHSVGGFYSASHPPLLIWTAYFVSLLFGSGSIVLKLIVFSFSLGCILLIMKLGEILFNVSAGFYAALIFVSNIIFTVFSQRFQLDMPYTFFILASFYFFFKYVYERDKKFIVLSGIAFGCCLMTKILVGFYIPLILFISYFFIRKRESSFDFKSLLSLSLIGILIALPWHLYMDLKFGSTFTDYFFGFHIYDRALHGVEHNEKNSGFLYHVNYLISIVPFSILAFLGIYQNFKKQYRTDWKRIFLSVWFLTGLIIITAFRTKLEVYVLLILLPSCFIIPLFISEAGGFSPKFKLVLIFATLLNAIWFSTESIRPELKEIFQANHFMFSIVTAGILVLVFLISKMLSAKIELKKAYYIFILFFSFAINIYYLVHVPDWVNRFRLSEIKSRIDKSENRNILYVSSKYRYNPQFSYYFEGLNLGWKNSRYGFHLLESLDAGDNFNHAKSVVDSLSGKVNFVLIEKDGINRATDYDPELYIPRSYDIVAETTGYKLYERSGK